MNIPHGYTPGTPEAGRSFQHRLDSGFIEKYLSGAVVLDIGYRGDLADAKPILPHAIGVDLDYPGYDGKRLPFADASVDAVFSSHCLEHIPDTPAAVRDYYRVLKVGGFFVCMVPHQFLYEKRRELPSLFNPDHKHLFTPASLLSLIEDELPVNSYRVRHLMDNDRGFDYTIGPEQHSTGCYEIELVIQKIALPSWSLA